MEQWRAEL
jgi:hypothetical protein